MSDLIQLNDDSIHLLPSAYVTERKYNTEIRWTPDLFSAEVLQLRRSIISMFDSVESETWSNFENWYAHTTHVWDTLAKFGANLLHYKTIAEIEARKELYEL